MTYSKQPKLNPVPLVFNSYLQFEPTETGVKTFNPETGFFRKEYAANLKKVASIQAYNSEAAFKKSKELGYRHPVIEQTS